MNSDLKENVSVMPIMVVSMYSEFFDISSIATNYSRTKEVT